MKKTIVLTMLVFTGASLNLLCSGIQSEPEGATPFVYVSDKRLATVELVGPTRVILNYINLGDSIEYLQSIDLLILDSNGTPYPGHLFQNEEGGTENPYIVNDLVTPSQFRGYDVLGNFRFETAPKEVYLRLGSRVIEFQSVTTQVFDTIAERVGRLDLAQPNSRIALADAGFWQGFGDIHYAGSEKAERIIKLLPTDAVLAPIIIKNPLPRLPERFSQLSDPVIVRLTAGVTKRGGIVEVKVKEGIDAELDQLAMEVVRNSWQLLPAISDGEVVDAELVLNVLFER